MTDSAAQTMLYDANKKSTGVTYLLWFFLGVFGGHRFYTGRTGTAIVQLILHLAGWALVYIGIGLLLLGILGVWLVVDAFLIPGWIRKINTLLATTLSSTNTLPVR